MKRILISALVFGFVMISTSAFAQYWANYRVISAGPYSSAAFPQVGQIISVQLEPVSGGSAQFYRLESGVANELLAIALTAVSTGQPVRANIETNYSNGHWSDNEVMTLFIYESEASLP